MKKCQAVARPAAHGILAMLLRGKGKVLPLLLVLALTACAAPGTPQETSASPSEGLVVLDEGTWPENIYTEGFTVPPGTVRWAVLDTARGYCGVSLTDLTDDSYRAYMEQLRAEGFSPVKESAEEAGRQRDLSVGALLSDGEKAVSISYASGNLSMYLSLVSDPAAQAQR